MYSIIRRILAIIGIIIVAGLYIVTFVIAISGGEHLHDWLIAAIAATVAVPCMLWVIQYLYKRLNADMDDYRNKQQQETEKDETHE